MRKESKFKDLSEGEVANICAEPQKKIKKKMPLTEAEMREVGAEYHAKLEKEKNYKALCKDWSEYLQKNKNKSFYFDKLLTRLLDKHDLSLKEYYEFTRKEENENK